MTFLEPSPDSPIPRQLRRESKWNKAAGVAGKVLIGAGVFILLFVLFQIFGTSYLQSKQQTALRQQIGATHIPLTVPTTTANQPPVTVATQAQPSESQPIAVISIPKISLSQVVVQGTNEGDLELGPGHYLNTPLPGENGNVAIAGHRTTWAKPFYNLDQLKPGDAIELITSRGTFTYSVTGQQIVSPSDVSVLDPTTTPTLTLTTCNPKYSAAQRLVVKADLTSSDFSLSLPPSMAAPAAGSAHKTTPHTSASILATILWGLFLVLLCVATWFASTRLRRRWLAYVLGAPFVLLVLFEFFAAISSHLPAGI